MKLPCRFLLLLLCLLFMPSCAHEPPVVETVESPLPVQEHLPNFDDHKKVEPPQKMSGRCEGFCEVIKTCVAKIKINTPDLEETMGGILCEIARCETGNKCRAKISSPKKRYKGPFQYAAATWRRQCRPFFILMHMPECLDPKAVFNVCCSSVCAAHMIDQGMIQSWGRCGQRAEQFFAVPE